MRHRRSSRTLALGCVTAALMVTLAGCVNLSATHFSRPFRRYFGSSPMHYVIQQRMARAASLLAETAAPIKQVAHAVGYDDPYYFSRLFKRTVGLAPGAYRKRAQTPAG